MTENSGSLGPGLDRPGPLRRFNGRVQRRVLRAFIVHCRPLTTLELVAWAHPRLGPGEVERKHRGNTAAVARKVGAVQIRPHRGRGGGAVWALAADTSSADGD